MQFTRSRVDQILPALGMNQAKLLKLAKNGRIYPGYNADLTLVDDDGYLKMTIVGGEILYQ